MRKALDMFAEIQQDKAKADRFNTNFGRYIKVGVIEDRDNKDALLKLASFASTEGDQSVTLPQYVERMKEGQKQIYYVSGASRAAAASSPVLEGLRKKGYEVLIALDQIDEIALQGVGKFGDFDVVDAAKEGADLGEQSDEEKASTQAAKESLVDTCAAVKAVLGDKVDKVEVSSRLTASPSALVQPQWGMSPQMQRFMKAQAAATGDDMGMLGGMAANLELNPNHPAVLKLKQMVDDDKKSAATRDYATLLYDVAAVSSGYEVADPAAFAARVVRLMTGEEPTAVVADPVAEPAAGAAEVVTADPAASSSKAEDDAPIMPEVL